MDRWSTLRLGANDVLVVPSRAVLPKDPATTACVIDDALAHPDGRAALARWLDVDDADLDDPAVRVRAIEAITQGQWRAVELAPASEIGGTADPRTDPTEPRKPDGPRPTRPTWIAITVVDEDGLGFARTSWTLTTAGGDDRSVRLDDDSTWRADDLAESGTCYLRIGATVPEPVTPLAGFAGARPEHAWIEAEPRGDVALRTGAAHTVIVVRGRTEIVVLDEEGRPEDGEWCEVTIDGHVQKRRTNPQGLLVVWHPRRIASIDVRFPLLSANAVVLDRSGPLATEAGE